MIRAHLLRCLVAPLCDVAGPRRSRRSSAPRIWTVLMTLPLTLAVFAGLAWPPSAASADSELVVVTSFPKELFEGYKKAFEAGHPRDIRTRSPSSWEA